MTQPDNTFSRLIARHDNGALDTELTNRLREVAAAVELHDKAGEVTLKVKIDPGKGTGDGAVLVTATFATKVPTPKPRSRFYFRAPDGTLTRNDPHQPALREDLEPDPKDTNA